MKMSTAYTYHFDEKRDPGAVNCNMNTYDRLKSEYLPQLKPFFESDGCHIYNCNPDSELKVFPMVSFEDAIKESTHMLGDVDRERSWGMYSKPDEKGKWKEESPEEQKNHLKTLEMIKQHQQLPPDTFKLPEKKAKPPKPSCPRIDGNGNPLPPIQPPIPHNINLSMDQVSTCQPLPIPPIPPSIAQLPKPPAKP